MPKPCVVIVGGGLACDTAGRVRRDDFGPYNGVALRIGDITNDRSRALLSKGRAAKQSDCERQKD